LISLEKQGNEKQKKNRLGLPSVCGRTKFFPSSFLFSGFFFTFLFLGNAPAFAQAVDAGTISRQLDLTLPTLPSPSSRDLSNPPSPAPAPRVKEPVKKEVQPSGAIPVWEEDRDPPDEQTLGAPIKEIHIIASHYREEINKIIDENLFNNDAVGGKVLASVRSKIWDLFIQKGSLVHVAFKLIPNPRKRETSVLLVRVSEITIQEIVIRTEGNESVCASNQDSIRKNIAREFKEGNILNLQALDARIKHRLRLGDYNLRVSLEPIDSTKIRIVVFVSTKEESEPELLIQNDNAGMRAFGQNRLIGVAGVSNVGVSGDRVNVTTLKTMDFERGQYKGLYYARGEYDAPLTDMEMRGVGWLSAMHYDGVKGASANPDSNGEAYEIGVGLSKPLLTRKESILDGRMEFVEKIETDRFNDKLILSQKKSHNGRVKLNGTARLTENQLLSYGLATTLGSLDLSGSSSSLAQDRAGPETNGLFSKIEANSSWFAVLDEAKKTDLRVNTRGQIATNNLDSMEKFTLGGSSGMRAFGPGEASGDAGLLMNAEAGYTLFGRLRTAAFYDAGLVHRNMIDYGDTSLPGSYLLQDVGVMLSMAYQRINSTFTFAHQVGSNPGEDSNGSDSDGLKRQYRLWYTLSYTY